MSQPRPFSLGCLDWHVFRFDIPSEWIRQPDGRVKLVRTERHEILEWCDVNIKGEWTWGGAEGSNLRPIYVKDKSDAMLLKLTWFDDVKKPLFYS